MKLSNNYLPELCISISSLLGKAACHAIDKEDEFVLVIELAHQDTRAESNYL